MELAYNLKPILAKLEIRISCCPVILSVTPGLNKSVIIIKKRTFSRVILNTKDRI